MTDGGRGRVLAAWQSEAGAWLRGGGGLGWAGLPVTRAFEGITPAPRPAAPGPRAENGAAAVSERAAERRRATGGVRPRPAPRPGPRTPPETPQPHFRRRLRAAAALLSQNSLKCIRLNIWHSRNTPRVRGFIQVFSWKFLLKSSHVICV